MRLTELLHIFQPTMELQIRLKDVDCLLVLLPILFMPLIGIPIGGTLTFGHLAMAYTAAIVVLNAILFIAGIFLGSEHQRAAVSLSMLGLAVPTTFLLATQISRVIDRGATDWSIIAVWPIIQATAAVLWFITVSQKDWTDFRLWSPFLVGVTLVLLTNVAYWIISGFEMPFTGLTQHKNMLGIACVVMAVISVATMFSPGNSRFSILVATINTGLAALLLLASLSRASIVAAATTVGIAVILMVVPRSRVITRVIVIAIIAVSALIPFAYLQVSKDQALERDPMGRPIYNGRETLWPIAMHRISEHPVFGHGKAFAARARSYHSKDIHAHNLFLAVLYHVGGLGLLATVAFLLSIWRILSGTIHNAVGIIMLSFFAGILVQSSFEVSLLYHHHSFFGMWTIFGIAAAYAMEDQRSRSEFEEGDGTEPDESSSEAVTSEFDEFAKSPGN